MSAVCHACAIEVVEAPITCNGFCKAVFHLKCSGIPTAISDELPKIKQLYWMCKSCSKLMDDVRFRSSVRGAYEAGQEHVLTAHSEIVENMKSSILSELKNEIRSNFTALINSSTLTPTTRPSATKSIRSRRLFQNTNQHAKDLMCGTGGSLSPSLGKLTASASDEKFWLYISRLARDVTVDQVRQLAIKRMGTDDVDVVRLVAKGKNVNTLTFISFKIGLNPDLKAKALSTSTWPKGILFREFKDRKSSGNFWKPHQTPTDNHSPSSPSGRSITDSNTMTE
ncbi:uncharacterized protein LOC135715327 [Ochlerotatus camptorhynchus]|uniref:uncharacterized protein LOC135708658 n=1 Tax=Ochlerotatus camptorhynchus TaxID=644619 RepID=UPI0031CF5A94